MKGFIEVTDRNIGRKVFINLTTVEAVFDEGMTASL